jgi:hypothetical protein
MSKTHAIPTQLRDAGMGYHAVVAAREALPFGGER